MMNDDLRVRRSSLEHLTVTGLHAASPGQEKRSSRPRPASHNPAYRNCCCLPILVELPRSLCAPTRTTRERKNEVIDATGGSGQALAPAAERAYCIYLPLAYMSDGGHCIYARDQQSKYWARPQAHSSAALLLVKLRLYSYSCARSTYEIFISDMLLILIRKSTLLRF
jgi:hypothetical protein